MGSSFFELNIATSGLFAAKAGLEITANNVSNMATLGYSRQYVKQTSSTPLDRYSGTGQVGTGTKVYGIGQYRDVYLDKKYWVQNSTYGEYTQKSTQLSFMQTIFGALSEGGITKNVNTFFDSISELQFSANDLNYRTAVINTADSFATSIRNHANQLRQQQIDLNDDVYALVERINSIGGQLASLNEQIYKFEIEGQPANDLRDRRTLLLDELSEYVNVETKEVPDGSRRDEYGVKFNVLINGQEFVSDNDNKKLEVVRRAVDLHPDDAPGLYDVVFGSGQPLNLNGLKGELKGLIDTRDGDSGVGTGGDYKGIPYYVNKLNEFVRNIATGFNRGQRLDGTPLNGITGYENGFDMDGNEGQLFFTMIGPNGVVEEDKTIIDYNDLNAFNFTVSDQLKENPRRLATSDSNDITQPSNNNIILGFMKLKDDITLFSEGSIYQFANALASNLGIDTKQAESFTKYYKDMTKTVDNQRMQVSGVSLNEEVANIVKYQHLYQTSSKLINVINDIYNTTINGLGI